jgi:LysR family transcriptional regulator, hydrogen peroxide-inducible genes activator
MQMHQIRYFLALSDELNFTRAARRCGVSQPTLSIAIRAFEHQLGGPLFERRPLIALTELGTAIRPHLLKIELLASIAVETGRNLGRASIGGERGAALGLIAV